MPPIKTKDFCSKGIATTALFGIPFSLELVLVLSNLINCRRCAKCCEQPRVYVTNEEIAKIAEYIGKPFHSTKALMHVKDNLMPTPCPFLERKDCNIYEIRPIACRIYPMFRIVVDGQPDKPRIACSLSCLAGIELHNLLSMEKL